LLKMVTSKQASWGRVLCFGRRSQPPAAANILQVTCCDHGGAWGPGAVKLALKPYTLPGGGTLFLLSSHFLLKNVVLVKLWSFYFFSLSLTFWMGPWGWLEVRFRFFWVAV
jgi:hypothetical protein